MSRQIDPKFRPRLTPVLSKGADQASDDMKGGACNKHLLDFSAMSTTLLVSPTSNDDIAGTTRSGKH